jgi:site-specific DNA-methyltransferase (adenine-specific)
MSARGRKRAEAPRTEVADHLAPIRDALGDRWPVAEGPGYLLVHGDCLDVMAAMPDGCVEVVMTDPPYEAEAHTEQRRQKGAKITLGGDDEYREVNEAPLTFAAITTEQRDTATGGFARLARHRALAFCQAEAVGEWKRAFNAGGMPYRRAIPWVKPDAMPSLHGRYPGQSYESIVLAQHPWAPACPVGGSSRRYEFTRDASLYSRAGASAKAPHPTTKPLHLMLAMVADFTDPGDLILDAFAGSGTTGLAAIRLGRLFVGIERDPAYFEIACRRLRGDEAKPRPEQPSLFATTGAA